GDYESERAILEELERYDEVDFTLGLANIEAMDGYMLTDKLTPRQFSEMTDIDYELVSAIYAVYAVNDEELGKVVNGLDTYSVPLIDMFLFICEKKDQGYVSLDEDLEKDLDELYDTLLDAKAQLQGENYTRLLVNLTLPEESEETFAFLSVIHQIAERYYDSDDIIVTGNSQNEYDLASSFVSDNLMISILSAVFVVIVLLFTFQSAGLPVLLILVIEGSIWINFSVPTLTNTPIFFLGYLIVSSIQMGANIDYAIVISSRYMELKQTMPIRKAIVQALNLAFPTILTSGTILASAGILIGKLSTNPVIAGLGTALGRGTIISMILVMGVLPQILLLGDIIVEKTKFTIPHPETAHSSSGTILVNGRVRGHVSGVVDANINGVIRGELNAVVESGSIYTEPDGKEAIRHEESSDENA
ncbi:MAG: MMPL family transporter, partial [Eubacteriales bacterium]